MGVNAWRRSARRSRRLTARRYARSSPLGSAAFLRASVGRRLRRGSCTLWESSLQLIFPPTCAGCGAALELDELSATGAVTQATGNQTPQATLGIQSPLEVGLCQACFRALTHDLRQPSCVRCAYPLSVTSDGLSADCLACAKMAFRFDRALALGAYRNGLAQAVVRMKRFTEYPLTTSVGRLLAQRWVEGCEEQPDAIVPIPKHWLKRWMRGTNTAEMLAETVGRSLGVPVAHHALRVARATEKQSLLGRGARMTNATGSLNVTKRYDWRKAKVLIVDDIMTTGATMNEAARVLRRAGADQVSALVAARAVSHEIRWASQNTMRPTDS